MSIFDMGKSHDFRPNKSQREFFSTPTKRHYICRPFIRTDYSSIVNSIKMAKEILNGECVMETDEVVDLITRLERTALELRDLIGEG